MARTYWVAKAFSRGPSIVQVTQRAADTRGPRRGAETRDGHAAREELLPGTGEVPAPREILLSFRP